MARPRITVNMYIARLSNVAAISLIDANLVMIKEHMPIGEYLKQNNRQINQSTKELIDHSRKELVNESTKELINQSRKELINESSKGLTNQSRKELINESSKGLIN